MNLALLDKFTPLTNIQKQHFTVFDQGTYLYQLNGKNTDIEEPWQILKNGDITIVRSVRYSKNYAMKLSVKAHITENNKTIELSYSEDDNDDIDAKYQLDNEGNWKLVQSHPGDIFQKHGKNPGMVIFPLLRIFTGEMLLACKSKTTQVLVPDIRLTASYNDKLKPSFDQRNAKYLGFSGKGKKYQFNSEHYQEEGAQCFLNKDGILSQYSWQQTPEMLWQITLQKA
ncbi:hypothetical protein [Thalassomonas sp. M1454]|uniref:hypothetical protein n=1 Tax=Thalassomonas sp. M1454 TaxID=2594477 RepID=UPI001180DB35|nr:hypothetical protein [Thalassomonas sp. M1454]TRX55040.1 hypothetical protein FNN08_10590 [Thalassomonas sp. M1454]